MPNIKLDKQTFPFMDSVKHPIGPETPLNEKVFHNSGYSTMNIEVQGTFQGSITVEGCINTLNSESELIIPDKCTYTQLGILNLSDYSVTPNISAPGIYAVGINGTTYVRIKPTISEGSVTVVGVAEV